MNQWQGIEAHYTYKDKLTGCCQEGQVHHTLSERLSIDAKVWSEKGIVMENRRMIMEQQIKELTLLLAQLTLWDDKHRLTKQENKKSWKWYDFGILNKLYEEEYIYQENKDKYFIQEEKGIAEVERLIEKYNINKE